LKIKIVDGKSQKIKVNDFLLAFLETVSNRCRKAIIIHLLKVLYIAYESIRFKEVLNKFYMLEAEICSKVLPRHINEVTDIWEKSSRALTESINSLNEKLLAKVERIDEKRILSPHEVLVKATETEFKIEDFGYKEIY